MTSFNVLLRSSEDSSYPVHKILPCLKHAWGSYCRWITVLLVNQHFIVCCVKRCTFGLTFTLNQHLTWCIQVHLLAVHYFACWITSFITSCIQTFVKCTPCPEKKRPRYFELQLSHFLVEFYNFCTIGNRNEYFTTIWNLLT